MSQIEKTVFISYRRTNIYTALAVYQALSHRGYDCFLDYQNIDSGAFDQIILNQIKARAHFILILTPSALERCAEPSDWLRREIETAIDHKRNIVPLMFEGFDYGDESIKRHLTGKLSVLSTYNALRVPPDFFEEAMSRLINRFLNTPLDTVLHPTPSTEESEVEKLQQATAIAPMVTEAQLSAEGYFERGCQFHSQGDYDHAIEAYSQTILLQPGFAPAYNNRGVAYMDGKNQYDNAIADYNIALRIQPDYAHVYNNRGWVYYNKGDIDKAVADYTRAIQLSPDDATTLNNRGIAFTAQGQFDLAIADFDKALHLIPDFALVYNNRAWALYQKGDAVSLLQGIKDVNKALQLIPPSPMFLHTRGAIRIAMEDYETALQDFETALKLDPSLKDIPEFADDLQKARHKLGH